MLWQRARTHPVRKRRRLLTQARWRQATITKRSGEHDFAGKSKLLEEREERGFCGAAHEYVVRIRGLHQVMQQQRLLGTRLQALEDVLTKVECRVRNLEVAMALLRPLSPVRSLLSASDSDVNSGQTRDSADGDSSFTQALSLRKAQAWEPARDASVSSSRRHTASEEEEDLKMSRPSCALSSKHPPGCIPDCFRLEWGQTIWRKAWIRILGPVTVLLVQQCMALEPRTQRLFPEAVTAPQYLCLLGFDHGTQQFRVRTTDGLEGFWANIAPSLAGGYQNEHGQPVVASRLETADWVGTRIIHMDPQLGFAAYAVIRRVWGDPVDTFQLEYEDDHWSRPLGIHSISFQCVGRANRQQFRFTGRQESTSKPFEWTARMPSRDNWSSGALETPSKLGTPSTR
jgi:hypothetical protein